MSKLQQLLTELGPEESIKFEGSEMFHLSCSVQCHNHRIEVAVAHREIERGAFDVLTFEVSRCLELVRKAHADSQPPPATPGEEP